MASQRRDFNLPISELEDLEQIGFDFDCIQENGQNWIVFRNYPIPPGYNVEKTDIAILINPRYPLVQLDMAYFHPPLKRTDNIAIPRDTFPIIIESKNYNGWSRHRKDSNSWRPQIDNISSHLIFVQEWFQREFILRPRQDETT